MEYTSLSLEAIVSHLEKQVALVAKTRFKFKKIDDQRKYLKSGVKIVSLSEFKKILIEIASLKNSITLLEKDIDNLHLAKQYHEKKEKDNSTL